MSKSSSRVLVLVAFSGALILACGRKAPAPAAATPAPQEVANPTAAAAMDAHATIRDKDGKVLGTVRFAEHEGFVEVSADLSGVPAGEHGFHLHAEGRCEGPDFTSAGGHFNPMSHIHGAPSDAEHHGGDLGNVQVQADGSGHLMQKSTELSVTPGANSVVGHAVVLHANPDDFKTQPTGNAGARIGCGVVEPGAG